MRAAISATTLLLALGSGSVGGQTARHSALSWDQHHAVLLVGLPGDKPHEAAFRSIANDLVRLLADRGMPRGNITVLDHDPLDSSAITRPVTRESITATCAELSQELTEDDALWLIFIGHADHDGEQARFHIPGPDLRAIDYADLLRNVRCREQVIWLTMSSSGWFLEPLSQPQRVIVTSTLRDAEPNETEFPAAMVEALGLPVAACDQDNDEQVSVLELFAKIHDIVAERYRVDQRAATEHAMIDDNGDGRGTEWPAISASIGRIRDGVNGAEPTKHIDGELAARLVIPQPRVSPPKSEEVRAETLPDEDP